MGAKDEARSRGRCTSSCQAMIEARTANEGDGNHFTVDWDGPDDPSNPKKSDLPARPSSPHSRLKSLPIAGHSARNGS